MLTKELIADAKNVTNVQFGEYFIQEYIGHGKIGVVYKGYHELLPDHPVAIKLTFESLKEGWENELYKVRKLSRVPGVVQLHVLGAHQIKIGKQSRLVQFTVWDFISPGRNLRQYLDQQSAISVSFYLAVIERLLWVLHFCEERDVARHGDLHAGNVFISDAAVPDSSSDSLDPVEGILVSDFGYGATSGVKQPKDDYAGIAEIANLVGAKLDWEASSAEQRSKFRQVQELLTKVLYETDRKERQTPKSIYDQIKAICRQIEVPEQPEDAVLVKSFKVGNYQSSEMFGDNWERWRRLFVGGIPARTHIFEPGNHTIVTGPRGCGKTTMLRRFSRRLLLECGAVAGEEVEFIAFYINANSIVDAFPDFPDKPSAHDSKLLTAYFHLCFLTEFMAVVHAEESRGANIRDEIFSRIQSDLEAVGVTRKAVSGENKSSRVRDVLEDAKRKFIINPQSCLALLDEQICHHTWLEDFLERIVRPYCDWVGDREIFLFVDDYTLPRVKKSVQQILNLELFRRTSQYITKLATEAATTFVARDSTEKSLQINDDYGLVDLATESLAMGDAERHDFLDRIFSRRLVLDPRIPTGCDSLEKLLGKLGLSKNAFAKLLREKGKNPAYMGWETFVGLWSGDTRTMLQLLQALVDDSFDVEKRELAVPISKEVQDRVLNAHGGQWIEDLTGYDPSDPEEIRELTSTPTKPGVFKGFVQDHYGCHLKAIVEAFQRAARKQLLGPMYKQGSNEVVNSAFRIEIQDELRLGPLAFQIYSDLVRYGIFLRDGRGKSVRGALVPRLFLRRIAIPFCRLGLTTKNSIRLNNDQFELLLLAPDEFKAAIGDVRRSKEKIKDDRQSSLRLGSKSK